MLAVIQKIVTKGLCWGVILSFQKYCSSYPFEYYSIASSLPQLNLVYHVQLLTIIHLACYKFIFKILPFSLH